MMILYSLLGLVMILSASSIAAVLRYGVPSSHFFTRQGVFLSIAFIFGFLFILRIPTKKYKYFAYLFVLAVVGGLLGLYIYGRISNGALSWYRVGFISLQPSEFAKPVLVLLMAVFYDRSLKRKEPSYYNLIPIGIALVIFALVARQPDLGGALIIAFIVFFTFIKIPMDKAFKSKMLKFVALGAAIVGVAFLFGGDKLLNSYQLERLTFKNPCSRYSESTGYQVCNGYIAINNGGLFGAGLGNSTQKYLYLPEAHTDFIFPILVEELGLLIGILVLVGFAFMLYRILKIAKQTTNVRNFILAYGAFLYMLSHLVVNLLGVLAIIPLTGVPLPFLSYGSSFNISLICMLFVVQRVAYENKTEQAKKELLTLK